MPRSSWPPPAPRWVSFLVEHAQDRNVAFLWRYVQLLVLVVFGFSVLFHVLTAIEGTRYPWWTGPYWSVSTMTTLGMGDIVFTSLAGQAFTAVVVLTGILFLLVLLPVVLMQFAPWIEARSAARIRRRLPRDAAGHVVLTHLDPVTQSLITRLKQYHYPYVLIVPDIEQALSLSDRGIQVMAGELDHPETYRAARLEQAALLAVTASDVRNTNAVFTARTVAPRVPFVATVDQSPSVEVLELAGSTHVFQFPDMLARALARRVLGGDALSHVVGHFDELLIAEANAARTPLVGKSLRDSGLRELVPVSVIGVWERGEFRLAGPDTEIKPHTVLVLAGTQEHLVDYDEVFAIYNVSANPVVVIGGGRVGQGVVRALLARGIPTRLVEKDPSMASGEEVVVGDASHLGVLEKAGIRGAPSVVITTHDDDMNVFLSLYCRRLRSDIQILSRATFEKNVETLHRAGADFVLSLATMGATAIFNLLERGEAVTLSEGLNLFEVRIPGVLAGKSLIESSLRQDTGCTVVALHTAEGMRVNPEPSEPLPAGISAVLIGSRDAEARFLERYGS